MSIHNKYACANDTLQTGQFNEIYGDFQRDSNAYSSLPNGSKIKLGIMSATAPSLTLSAKAATVVPSPALSSSSSSSSAAAAVVTLAPNDDGHTFGLSSNLSSESLKKACDYYDDELSDEDLIQIQCTPHSFYQAKLATNTKNYKDHSASALKKLDQQITDQHPLWTVRLSDENIEYDQSQSPLPHNENSSSTFPSDSDSQPDEALSVLNELDAILDSHDTSQLNTSTVSSDNIYGDDEDDDGDDVDEDDDDRVDDKIKDYLMDLDNYLEELDKDCMENGKRAIEELENREIQRQNLRTRTLPINRNRKHIKSALEPNKVDSKESHPPTFKRGHELRKTISCALHPQTSEAFGTTSPSPTELEQRLTLCRHNSMRNLIPLSSVNNTNDYDGDDDDDRDNLAKVNGNGTQEVLQEIVNRESEPVATTATAMQNSLDSEIRRCYSQGTFNSLDSSPLSSRARGNNQIEMLTDAHIFNTLLQNETQLIADNRPRQFGRRGEGYMRPMTVETELPEEYLSNTPHRSLLSQSQHERRPMSAPAQTAVNLMQRTAREQADRRNVDRESFSDMSSIHCSRIPSPISVASSSDSNSTQANIETNNVLGDNHATANSPLDPDGGGGAGGNGAGGANAGGIRQHEKSGFNREWPHGCSRTLALIGCTLGLFNICRFAVLTINYGGNFLLQFLLLTIIFGIPLFWLQMSLGAKIKAGPVSMWKISPICTGIGIAFVMVQSFIAIYSTVSIAWVLVYLRDTFPSKGGGTGGRSVYRWQEMAFPYRFAAENSTGNLTDTVADYFNVVVLQRLQFARRLDGGGGSIGVRFHVNDRLAFYLALIWALVFLILCKGLKSLGKVVYLIFSLPLIALIVVTFKFVYILDPNELQNLFAAMDFDDFLINSKTWIAATQETFLTWGLLGASVIAITSRTHAASNKSSLRRDAIMIVLITLLGLSVTALLGLCSAQILKKNGFIYAPGSFESPESSTAVYSLKAPIDTELLSYPHNLVPHYSSFVGETYSRPNAVLHRDSGYQALRFLTELLPAVLSLTTDSISWVWAAVAYSMFAGFGLGQLCIMWKPISSALGNSTSSVLLSCVTGLLLSIPFATEMGITILYYMDFLIGGAWFIPIIWTTQILGVFLIRGRPYNGDDLVNDLNMTASMSAFLALSWNVLLPIGLITLAVIEYKISLSNQFYYWRGKSYFSYWARKVGSLIQIGILIVVPITAIIQIYRYLTKGPPDVLERIQLLYRPSEEASRENRRPVGRNGRDNGNRYNGDANDVENNEFNSQPVQNDAPPKYTPPPSYTTATGARLAKLLRQSIRRSVRRVLGDQSRARPTLSSIEAESNQQNSPPDYLTILTNPTGNVEPEPQSNGSVGETIEINQRPTMNPYAQRSLTLGRKILLQKQQQRLKDGFLQHRPTSARANLEVGSNLQQRPYTAEDVVTILRSSVRNRQTRTIGIVPTTSSSRAESTFRSIENLVLNAEPPDQTPGVAADATSDNVDELNNTSVI